jgi:hypothetical protein
MLLDSSRIFNPKTYQQHAFETMLLAHRESLQGKGLSSFRQYVFSTQQPEFSAGSGSEVRAGQRS